MAEAGSDPMRWARRAGLVLLLICGWLFILGENRFHITPPVVFVCLGYLAVVMTVWNLWRTGSIAVAAEQATEEAWTRPIGARGELEKEKRTLLKAIKEAEFDHEMGKLSKADADEMVHTYRTRAIAVIKELDRMTVAEEGNVRDRIDREVRARLELKAGKVATAVKDAPKDAPQAAEPKPEADAPQKAETA